MSGLLFPELLLLALPALACWWLFRRAGRLSQAVRLSLVFTLVLALAAPFLRRPARGRDVVVLVDRSASMPVGSLRQAEELIALVEDERGDGDRVGVVSLGRAAVVEQALSEEGRFAGFERSLDPDGSDIAGGLEAALALVPEGRMGRVLLISDGEATGREASVVARRAAARGIEVHVRALERPLGQDRSVETLDLPERVHEGEPFQFSAWVRSDFTGEQAWVLTRDGHTLAQGSRAFEVGLNRLMFRDLLGEGGVARYELRLLDGVDPLPENDRAEGAVLVEGPRGLLVLNQDGQVDTLVNTLRSAGLRVEVASPEQRPLDPVALTHYRGVVLEDVEAGRVGMDGMQALADFVSERGGGLWITGGRASFGLGGYHSSPLDPILPVSMELKQEHRKIGMALSIALDRSGSMAMEAAPGVTKMDLANDGTAAAIRLLTPIDSVAVTAVDSSAHRVLALTAVTDPGGLARQASHVESMGGGIYTRTALQAAHHEIDGASHPNRHIILFSDAADSEEQEGVADLVDWMYSEGITLSVIALGTPQDPDSDFLVDIADRGGGEIYFTTSPQELPRLFAMDTLIASKAAFVDTATPTKTRPELFGLGELPEQGFPSIGGYNLVWPRDGANLGVVTTDDNAAPVIAFHSVGLGRSVAWTGQIGGTYGQTLVAWPGFPELAVTTARWLQLAEEPQTWFAEASVQGSEALIRLEAASDKVSVPGAVVASLIHPDGELSELRLSRVSETAFEARVPLDRSGVTVGTLKVGETPLALPPLVVPQSPEFKHRRDASAGPRALRKLAEVSGGRSEASVSELFEGESEGTSTRVLSRELGVLALLFLMVEIAGRRLHLWGEAEQLIEQVVPKGKAAPRGTASAPARGRGPDEPTEPTEPTEPKAPEPEGIGSALSKARKKASRKLDR